MKRPWQASRRQPDESSKDAREVLLWCTNPVVAMWTKVRTTGQLLIRRVRREDGSVDFSPHHEDVRVAFGGTTNCWGTTRRADASTLARRVLHEH